MAGRYPNQPPPGTAPTQPQPHQQSAYAPQQQMRPPYPNANPMRPPPPSGPPQQPNPMQGQIQSQRSMSMQRPIPPQRPMPPQPGMPPPPGAIPPQQGAIPPQGGMPLQQRIQPPLQQNGAAPQSAQRNMPMRPQPYTQHSQQQRPAPSAGYAPHAHAQHPHPPLGPGVLRPPPQMTAHPQPTPQPHLQPPPSQQQASLQARQPPANIRPGGMRPMPGQAQRPIPPDVSAAANGIQQMSMTPSGAPGYPGAAPLRSGPPPGMRAAPITDARSLPRPDMSGPAVAVRIATGDPPPKPPPVDPAASFPDPVTGQVRPRLSPDPAACPAEIFVPASPRCVRLSVGAFPMTVALSKKYSMPIGAVVQPLAKVGPEDEPVPVVNFGASGIVRCRRCRSYVNFSCSFRDGGRRWLCSMCSYSNDVPSDYFAPLDQNGKRRDAAERPELHRGSVEFVAPAEYMVRPPMPPVYMFLLEVTPAAANSGALQAMVTGIKRSIDSMPDEGRTRVGVITFDSSVHFYTLRPGPDAEPSVSIVSDITDVFVPTPNSILVQLDDCRPCFERALDMIANTHTRTNGMVSAASCLGAAVKGAQKAMEYVGGKMIVLAASRPTAGPGALRERGDISYLGTDRERAVLRPDNSTYRQIAVMMSKSQISCDLFICPPPHGLFLDVATLAQLVKFTGGELFHCPNFDAPKDAPRLQLAVNRTLARETGLEAVMRIRATKSVRCSHFNGRFFVRSTDLLGMPNVDSDKAYAVEFNFDESSLSDGPFCLQVALLYTTTSGERRIRVHTLAVPVTNSLADLFMRVDAPTTANLFARQAAQGMKDRALDELKKNLTEKVISALAKYREVCQSQYPAVQGNTQLLLPDAMTLLPLYMHGLSKSPILSRDACGAFLYRFDDKAALIHDVDVMNVAETSALLYPNMIPVYPPQGPSEKQAKYPNGTAATVASLKGDCGILIDDGRSLILWLGTAVLQQFTTDLLGSSVTGPVDPRYLAVELMRRGGSAKGGIAHVYSTVKNIIAARKPALPFHVVPAGDQRMQPRVETLMTEDRTASTVNYREFLLEVQRRVTQIATKR